MTVLHITAGSLKGRRVTVPPHDLRPTSTRARQAFFNIAAGRLPGARFLDLFAGSGIFAFEAISRGAVAATAVDQSMDAVRAISATAERIAAPVEVVRGEVFDALRRLGAHPPFDLVYADPPYSFPKYPELITALDASVPLAGGALVAVEHIRKSSPAEEVETVRLRFRKKVIYGTVAISLFDNSIDNALDNALDHDSARGE